MAEMQSDISESGRLENSEDRRTSARVPLDRPVRIGLPGGLPYATVSARDVSSGGLFIDAERNVRVGAKFSVEVSFEEGERIYVSEAEVVDNRSRGDGGGFGVRFLSISQDARRVLEHAVSERASVTLRSLPAIDEPGDFDACDLPTMETELRARVSPEPILDYEVEPVSLEMGSLAPSALPPRTNTVRVRTRTRWSKMKAWFRSFPGMSGAVYALTAILLLLVSVAVLWDESNSSTQAVQSTHRTVTADIHERLVDGAAPAGVSAPMRVPSEGGVVNRLPDKTPTGSLRKSSGSLRASSVEGSQGRAPPTAMPAQANSNSEDAQRKTAEARTPKASIRPRPAPPRAVQASSAGPVSASRKAPSRGRPSAQRAVAAPVTAKGVAKKRKGPSPRPEPSTDASKGSKGRAPATARLEVGGVGTGARVKAQYVLRKPERFVVDVTGVVSEPSLPGGEGRIHRVRFGRHDGFVRFVVDARSPIRLGKAQVRNGRLEVALSFR